MGKELKRALFLLGKSFIIVIMFMIAMVPIWEGELPAKVLATIFIVVIILAGIDDSVRKGKL